MKKAATMDTEEEIVRTLLESLGEVNQLFRKHAVLMERQTGVKSVATRLEVVAYGSGTMIEGFMDVETQNRSNLCWCLDVNWTDEAFEIEGSLDLKSDVGTETLKQTQVEAVKNVTDLPEAIKSVASSVLTLRPD